MPFTRPTLSQLITRTGGDIETRLPGADSGLRHSVLNVLARALSGLAAGLYGYLDHIARQILPDTADGQHLARHAANWGIRRKAASAATGAATATGTDGVIIPAGTEALRIDGTAYRVTQEAVIAGGSAFLILEAVESGPEANLTNGVTLTLASAITGINAAITITQASTAGTVEETDDALRDRLLARIRQPPQGGAKHDYIAWALEQPGVTRAWVWPAWLGAANVGVSFVMDDRTDIIPLAADVAAVQDAIDELRPVIGTLTVFAPAVETVDLLLRITPDTPQTRAAITGELEDFFLREAEPGGTIYLSRIGEAISLAEGEFQHEIEAPGGNYTAATGAMPFLGQVSFL